MEKTTKLVVRVNNMNKIQILKKTLLFLSFLIATYSLRVSLKLGLTSTLPTFAQLLTKDMKALMKSGNLDFCYSSEYLKIALPNLREITMLTIDGFCLIIASFILIAVLLLNLAIKGAS